MHLLADEPFFVVFPDDFFLCDGPSSIQQILDVYKDTGKSVIQTMHVDGPDIERYGIVQFDDEDNGIVRVRGLVEKPDQESAPSNVASVGGYLLTPDILPIIKELKPGNGGEIGLSDAVSILAQQDQVYGKIIKGTYHDAGNKARYLEAVVDATLRHPELQTEFRAYLESRLKDA
jgi:UTP--glucose-1-phosphate uridylyltransferase